MDYNKAFWPKSSSFFVHFLLQSGRCYKAEICTIAYMVHVHSVLIMFVCVCVLQASHSIAEMEGEMAELCQSAGLFEVNVPDYKQLKACRK